MELVKEIEGLLQEVRGYTEITDLIEFIAFVACIAKDDVASFRKIINTGRERQIDALKVAGEQLFAENGLMASREYYGKFFNFGLKTTENKIVSLVICIVSDIKDFGCLVKTLRQMAKNDRRFGSTYTSNISLEKIFKALIGDCSDKSLYDGACGFAHISSSLKPDRVYLEEINLQVANIARLLLILEDIDFKMKVGNALINAPGESEYKFDLAVVEPPVGVKFGLNDRIELAHQNYVSISKGSEILPASSSDSIWIQLILSKLKENSGVGYILLPQGILFRGGYDAKTREYLIENELLDAVIGLPKSILDYTAIPPVILVLRKNRPSGSPVIFIDANDLGQSGRSEITDQEAKLIGNLVAGNFSDDKYAKAVYIPEIRANSNILSISQYIQKNEKVEKKDLKVELEKLDRYRVDFENTQQKLISLLNTFHEDR